MNVHVIRDSDVSQDLYQEVIENLKETNGPIKFYTHENFINFNDSLTTNNSLDEEDFKKKIIEEYSCYMKSCGKFDFPIEREELSPKKILKKCNDFRKNHDIGKDEFIILLTEKANTLNWFSYGDMNKNIFIHTSEWDFYLDCNRSFPITYQVVSNILQSLLFKNMTDLKSHIHVDESRGCVNDFCLDKKDIRLKMKTADICTDCQNLIIDRSFPYPIFQQITNTFENLRKKLISVERFTSRIGPGRVLFKGHNRKMILLDAGNYVVKFTPLEKTVYHLFLENPDGIKANDIESHKDELKSLYGMFFNGSNIAQFNNSINALCDYFDGSMQEKISRINSKLRSTVGLALAESYIIKRSDEDEKYKVTIDRSLLSYSQ